MNNQADVTVNRILAGDLQVVSHRSASQYRQGSVSACGLAALNCARIILTAERDGIHGRDLLRYILTQSTAESITSICRGWTSTSHLDVEDILRVPVFSRTLRLMSSKFAQPSVKEFKSLLLDIKKSSVHDSNSAAVVITRPPEIITCLRITIPEAPVFVVFDSHPRPSHPKGAGFTCTTSLDDAAGYLAKLLTVDKHVLADVGMQWQLQLLSNFSGHIFVATAARDTLSQLTQTVMDSSLEILALQAQVEDLKHRNTSLLEENRRLERDSVRPSSEKRTGKLTAIVQPHKAPSHRAKSQAKVPVASSSKLKQNPSPDSSVGRDRSSSPIRPIVYYSGDPTPRGSSTTAHGSLASTSSATWNGHKLTAEDIREAEWQLDAERMENEEQERQHLDAELMEIEEWERAAESIDLQLIVTRPSFECGICLEKFSEDAVARVDVCDHAFCRDCLRNYIISKANDHRYPIPCPICMTESSKEPCVITDSLVQDLGIPEECYLILEELQIAAFSILIHCRQCQQSIFVDRIEYQEERIIVCPLPGCNYAWCKACQQKIDIGGPRHSCDGSSELDHLMAQRGWKYCPGCTTPIQKDSGCNHMTCMSPNCNTHFCYVCGESIVKSGLKSEIKRAVSAHYSVCRLFEEPAR